MKFRLFAVAMAIGLAACTSTAEKKVKDPFKTEQLSQKEQRALAAELYWGARASLDSADFSTAVQRYELLISRFPFTDFAVQGQLEKVYALYRSFKPDEALTEAEHFLRDYPRHPNADYVQYVKGLVNYDRDRGMEALMGLDTSKRDTTNMRRSFDDFAMLIQKYPNSRYHADARQRMIDVRNRIAAHELTVVEYYMRRGAYVAAAKRAEQVVAQFPGAPASIEALRMLEDAYDRLGMKDQAGDAKKLRQAFVTPKAATVPAAPARAPDALPKS